MYKTNQMSEHERPRADGSPDPRAVPRASSDDVDARASRHSRVMVRDRSIDSLARPLARPRSLACVDRRVRTNDVPRNEWMRAISRLTRDARVSTRQVVLAAAVVTKGGKGA